MRPVCDLYVVEAPKLRTQAFVASDSDESEDDGSDDEYVEGAAVAEAAMTGEQALANMAQVGAVQPVRLGSGRGGLGCAFRVSHVLHACRCSRSCSPPQHVQVG